MNGGLPSYPYLTLSIHTTAAVQQVQAEVIWSSTRDYPGAAHSLKHHDFQEKIIEILAPRRRKYILRLQIEHYALSATISMTIP